MKKWTCLILAALLTLSLAACGAKPEEKNEPTPTPSPSPAPTESAEWTREGFFQDDDQNMLSVTLFEDVVDPGWYVGCMLGEDLIEDSWGGTLKQENGALRGELASSGSREPLIVTVTDEGDDGLRLDVEGGETWHFHPIELPDAAISVTINIEGWGGMIGYAEGETAPELDPEQPYQSALINLAESAVYTFAAAPETGHRFVKWTKDGEDYSEQPVITVELTESADFVAVFEEDPDWQNPVMNFVGEYQCGELQAEVACSGYEEAWIIIERNESSSQLTHWDIFGKLDTDTLTIRYEGCTKSIVTYDAGGDVASQEPEYENGTGTITFGENNTFTWHEDPSDSGEDMVFEWVPVNAE